MAVLANSRHEIFAQEVAKGLSNREAYAHAGYETANEAATDASASRLLSTVKVAERVAELQAEGAARVGITVADITRRLLAIAVKGETSTEAPMLSVGRAALMDAAKLNGLVSDNVNLNATGELADRLARARGRAG